MDVEQRGNQQWQIVAVSGNLFKIVNRNSGKVLDDNNNSHSRGTQLVQWTWNGGSNQLWSFEQTPTGSYVVHNAGSGQVLEVGGASTTAGASVDQWMSLGQINQQWAIQ